MRSITTIEGEIELVTDQIEAAKHKLARLRSELQEARLAEAESNPHPWLGKRVQRTFDVRRGKTRTQRGTVIVRKPGTHYRGSYAAPGKLIVVSDSGLTAHDFDVRPGSYEGPWELSE